MRNITKKGCAALLAVLVLAGCAQKTKEPSQQQESPAPNQEQSEVPAEQAPQMSPLTEESTSARKAYAAALKTLLDTNVLPDGTDFSDGYIGSIQDRERMAENKFTVYDVDGDGREELVLLYAAAPAMAGMAGFVYDYDAQKQALRSQLTEFPALTFYENGAVKADWSHNQGKAGEGFWPYNLYLYDQETDSYQEAASVDAWDRETFPEEYPSTADTSDTGRVYYIYRDLAAEWDQIDPVDESAYQSWLDDCLGGAGELSLPYLSLTAEHIQSLLAAG
ncbi:hypothetical protein [Dysosmobacter sp.]